MLIALVSAPEQNTSLLVAASSFALALIKIVAVSGPFLDLAESRPEIATS
jgi:hypothetical protein